MYSCVRILSLLLLCLPPSLAYFNGADEESCYNHYIRHTTTVSGITVVSPSMVCDPCGYTLWVVRELNDTGGSPREIMTTGEFNYKLNTTYEIEQRPGNNGFLGFLIQARVQNKSSDTFDSSTEIAGTWADEGMDSLYRPLRCNISSAGGSETFPNSATQRDANDLRGESTSVFLRWTAPTEDPGDDLVFWFTIVQLHISHFFPVKGPVGILDRRTGPTPTTQEPTTEPIMTEVSSTVSNSSTTSGSLENLANQTVTEETLPDISAAVSSFVAMSANSTLLQTPENLEEVSTVFENIADFVVMSNANVTDTVVENLAGTLNSLIQWEPANLVVDSTSMIVESFETVISAFAQQDNITIELTNITIVAELGSTETFMATGRTASFDQAGVSATIALPPSLFNEVPANRPLIGVFFNFYENSALLPADGEIMRGNEIIADTAVGSYITGATVGSDVKYRNLDPPVTITLGLLPFTRSVSTNLQTVRCASWDFFTQSWITDGCTTKRAPGTTNFNCECNHLTNFAILIDICRRAQDCVINSVADEVLSYITYIGVAASCISLILTVITLLVFKSLREKDNSKYHIQLSVALFCLLVVFVAGVERGIHVYGGCIAVSVLVHYFSLVSVMWMGAEALLLFQKLVIVFMKITKKFLIILSLICWLVPLIPVLIPMIVDLVDGTNSDTDLIITRNYDATTNTLSGFCFHKHPGVFFGAFLVPILLVILFNLVIFIWVVVILVRHTRGQMKRSNEAMRPRTALRLIVSITSVTLLFGLTWLFAAFTFTIAGNDGLRITFQALFTVFASFQGFFIFLFFCVLNKEARESWRELLSCGRYKSDFLRPSQYKNTSSGGSGPARNRMKTGSTATTSAYNSSTIPKSPFDPEASLLPEKPNLGKDEEEIHTEIPLTATNGTDKFGGESKVKETSKVEAESKIDGKENKSTTSSEENKEQQMWLKAEPVKKARVKRYSTKKVAKHHVEEFEIDFGNEESSEDEQEQLEA